MDVAAGATYEAVVEWGDPGLTIGMTVIDNIGGTAVARVTGFTEIEPGIYSRPGNIAPADLGQYTLLYDDDGGAAAIGHSASEELIVTSAAATGAVYATVDELMRRLKIRVPTAEQEAQGTQVLLMAAGEINSEIDLAVDADALAGWQLALTAEVNLERAVELWAEAPFGLIGLDNELVTHTARNSWERYAHKLAPLKGQWGIS